MNRTYLIVAGPVVALAASLGALLFAEDSSQRELGLQLAPFVTISVIVVHALAALPLSLLAARRWAWLAPAGLSFATGVSAIALTLASGSHVGPWLEEESAGFLKRALLRTGWCFMLQLPWCLLAFRFQADFTEASLANNEGYPVWELVLSLVLAIAIPALYVVHWTNRQAAALNELRERSRIARALPIAESICQLGRERGESLNTPGREAAEGISFHKIRMELRQQVRELKEEIAQPLPNDADRVIRIHRARVLAQLDRLDEAEALLRGLVKDDAGAMLLLATVLQDRENWEESSDWYRSALDERYRLLATDGRASIKAVSVAGGGPISLAAPNLVIGDARRALSDCIGAYDGLAFNARARRDFNEGERLYREALEKLPAAKAHFHFQLGRHYEVAGRPGAAVEQFREAARLDPKEYGASTEERIKKLRTDTPACFLGGMDETGRGRPSR